MMTLKDVRSASVTASTKASDITRQLALAGIAIIWIFKTNVKDGIDLPDELYLPLTLIVGSLILDLAQYIVKTILYSGYNLYKEKKVAPDKEFFAPHFLNAFPLFFFFTKIATMIVAYYFLFDFLNSKLK